MSGYSCKTTQLKSFKNVEIWNMMFSAILKILYCNCQSDRQPFLQNLKVLFDGNVLCTRRSIQKKLITKWQLHLWEFFFFVPEPPKKSPVKVTGDHFFFQSLVFRSMITFLVPYNYSKCRLYRCRIKSLNMTPFCFGGHFVDNSRSSAQIDKLVIKMSQMSNRMCLQPFEYPSSSNLNLLCRIMKT